MTHPILSHRNRLLLYLLAWLPAGVLIGMWLARASRLTWLPAQALAIPIAMVYAFVCLAAWYPARATPLRGAAWWMVALKHGVAAALSSSVWQAAGGAWAAVLSRVGGIREAYPTLLEQVPSLFVVGVLVYLLAVAACYLTMAFEDSRRAETLALEAEQRQALAARELELTRELQQRLLPPGHYEAPGVLLAARNLAARFVAGDFFDYFRLPDGSLAVAIADVSGKGVAASLITATVKAVLPLIAAERSVTATLTALNERLVAQLGPREFVALALARLVPETGHCEIVNAGLPDPYVLPAAGGAARTVEVPQPRLPLGVWSDVQYVSTTTRLAEGDSLLLITDGLPEAMLPSGEPLGYGALAGFLDGEARDPGARLDDLFARLKAATRQELDDDWTAVLVQRPAPGAGGGGADDR